MVEKKGTVRWENDRKGDYETNERAGGRIASWKDSERGGKRRGKKNRRETEGRDKEAGQTGP